MSRPCFPAVTKIPQHVYSGEVAPALKTKRMAFAAVAGSHPTCSVPKIDRHRRGCAAGRPRMVGIDTYVLDQELGPRICKLGAGESVKNELVSFR